MFYDEIVLKTVALSKCYLIYNQPIDRLKQSIIPKIRNIIGKPSQNYYREFWALQNLNLEVKKGETIGIIGRNGSGKSTLLQLICKTLSPTSGTIETKGRIAALLELGSGFNPEFTGRENIYLNGAILGLSQDEIMARFDAITEFADIGEFIEQPIKFYSSGMTVRLAFAVQAMIDPDILIVDEALAVGDERFQRKCFRRIKELKEKGTSILFVSHAGQQIIELCDRALLLEHGQRLLTGEPLTVVRAYQKLIYANPDKQPKILQEIISSDKDDGKDISKKQSVVFDEAIHQHTEYSTGSEIDFYEAGMLPQSTEVYPIQGARVDSIKIFNLAGKEVNNLLHGREYHFEIRGTFLENRESVYISFGIRIKSGAGMCAIYYPGYTNHIQRVKVGQKFRLVHKLKMRLNPNTYFVNAGIFSAVEPTCMHRITDAIMFRVLPSNVTGRVFGYVNLTKEESGFEIINIE